MATPTAVPNAALAAKWLHWLFVRGDRAVSCGIDVRTDGTLIVSLVPLWSPDDQITETFINPADAVRWQETMTRRLQSAGWGLVEAGIVTNAA
jgi:hypothetical protein